MRKYAAAAALLLMSCNQASEPPAITVYDAWARATAPGQTSSALYFTIRNEGGADRLLTVSTAAGAATLHSTSMDGGIMRMRALDGVDVAAHSNVTLKPGAVHVMVTGLKQPLGKGSLIPVRLTFAKSGEIKLGAAVRSPDQGMVM